MRCRSGTSTTGARVGVAEVMDGPDRGFPARFTPRVGRLVASTSGLRSHVGSSYDDPSERPICSDRTRPVTRRAASHRRQMGQDTAALRVRQRPRQAQPCVVADNSVAARRYSCRAREVLSGSAASQTQPAAATAVVQTLFSEAGDGLGLVSPPGHHHHYGSSNRDRLGGPRRKWQRN